MLSLIDKRETRPLTNLSILLHLFMTNRPLYHSLTPHFSQFITEMAVISLFEQHGFISLNISLIPPKLVQFRDLNALHSFWGVYLIYSNAQFCKAVQDNFFRVHVYPVSSFLDNQIQFSSVLGSSIIFEKHFVDLIWISARTEFYNGNPTFFPPLFRDLIVFAFVNIIYERLDDISFVSDMLSRLPFSTNPVIHDFIKRTSAQIALLSAILVLIGDRVSMSMFKERSLPELLRTSLPSMDSSLWETLRATDLVSVPEDHRLIDYDFALSYFLIRDLLKLTNGINPQILVNIEKYLTKLTNDEIRQTVLIDLFSLLFLRDRKGNRFVFSRNVAVAVLPIFTKFATKYLTFFKYGEIVVRIVDGEVMTAALLPDRTVFAKALAAREFDFAETFHVPHNNGIVEIAREVALYPETKNEKARNEIAVCFSKMKLYQQFHLF
jgi:hypothetical protein